MRSLVTLTMLFASVAIFGQAPQIARPTNESCGPVGASYMRTTLYFGLNRRGGNVSGGQWKAFVRDEVTARFPQGHTAWEAGGQWRRSDGTIIRERSKVLLLVHDDSPAVHDSIRSIIERYKSRFEQESVLWETARV